MAIYEYSAKAPEYSVSEVLELAEKHGADNITLTPTGWRGLFHVSIKEAI